MSAELELCERHSPAYQVGKVDQPCKACCLWSEIPQNNVCNGAWNQSMEAASSKWIVDECEPSYDCIDMTACRSVIPEVPAGLESTGKACLVDLTFTGRHVSPKEANEHGKEEADRKPEL